MQNLPDIFISYCHRNKDMADMVDNHFKSIGITFKRDVRDLKFRESIKEFMKEIRESGYALLMISDEYLKSKYCMYEVLEFVKDENFKERVLPVIVDDADIYSAKGMAGYIKYWQTKEKEFQKELEGIDATDSIALLKDLKIIKEIRSNINEFLEVIGDMKSIPLPELQANNYKDILDLIGYENEGLLSELFKIAEIKDKEERELALEEFLDIHPAFEEAHFYRAFWAYEDKELKRAQKYYLKTLKLNPQHVDAYNNLGIVYQDLKNKEESKKSYDKAIALNPGYAIAYYNMGFLMEKDYEDIDEAMKYYRKAIELNPQYHDAYHNLARLLERTDKELAKKNYEEAIRLDPKLAKSYIGLGNILRDKGSYAEAIKCYMKTVELEPGEPAAYYNLGCLHHIDMGDTDTAAKYYRKAIELNPAYIEAYNNLGNILEDENYEEAKKHYEKALEINPHYIDALYNLGRLLETNDLKLSRKYYEEVVRHNPKYAKAYTGLGNISRKEKNYPEAQKYYEEAIKLTPGNHLGYYNLALVKHFDMGDKEGAIKYYQKAIELNPGDLDAYNFLGLALQELEDFDGARKNYEKAIEIDPEFGYSYLNLGFLAIIKDGNIPEGKRLYRKAVKLDPSLKSKGNDEVFEVK